VAGQAPVADAGATLPDEADEVAAVLATEPLGPQARARAMLRSQTAMEALAQLLFPLYALALVALARPVAGMFIKTNLLRMAIAFLMAAALVRAIVYVVSRLTRTPALVAFERTLLVMVWSAMLLYVTGYWVEVVDLLESVVIPVGKQRISLLNIVTSSFWVLLCIVASLWIGGMMETRLLASKAMDASLRAVLSRLLRALLLMAGVLVGFSTVGLDLTALSVFGGALGVGLGLGLQRIASNYISGFIVLLERTLRIGDMIKVDQCSGQVREIRTRFTVLRALDGVEHIVPNEMLTSLPVQNFSTAGALRIKASVQVAYGTDIDKAAELAVAAALATPRVLASPPPVVLLREFASDGLNLDLSFSIGDPQLGQGNVISDVSRQIWNRFRTAGIDVPFPQREVRIVGPVAANIPGTGAV
jgi:small-conductance mechanosensitive channel